ncbi:helix-turn-helix domain-containing protein [Aliivibrio salmonicida]|jgi:transcriptional regulator with XRE-family HTH domain|uniref:helix-turn-helix domain-containing protein n=1 Tax=Aliivibrio salmonicida TaxID=40269 RepID=UPI00406D4CDD
MGLGKKIKAIRLAENISQDEFSKIVNISVGTIRNYEQGIREPKSEILIKITNHERFDKYAYWLLTGKTLPESGQVCPAFSIQEQCGIISEEKNIKRA